MKTEEDRQAEADMKQSGAGTVSTRKFRNTLEHALVQAGYKPPKKKESEVRQLLLAPALACTLVGLVQAYGPWPGVVLFGVY